VCGGPAPRDRGFQRPQPRARRQLALIWRYTGKARRLRHTSCAALRQVRLLREVSSGGSRWTEKGAVLRSGTDGAAHAVPASTQDARFSQRPRAPTSGARAHPRSRSALYVQLDTTGQPPTAHCGRAAHVASCKRLSSRGVVVYWRGRCIRHLCRANAECPCDALSR